ncbi:DUF4232 domain-containing protein [Actinoplanes sp. NPDC049596]|uniref:DUF4232 domain-containing protein n=1 Tax=unclassified Actinoplanes TaxID=2626549 RepID=UPI003442D002
MGNVKQAMVVVAGLAGVVLATAGCAGPSRSTTGASDPAPSASSAGAGATGQSGSGSDNTGSAGTAGSGTTGSGDSGSGATGSGGTGSGGKGTGSGTSTTSSGSSSGGGAGTPECRTADLQVTDQAGAQQNAGTHTERLVFRNAGSRTCFVEGYPGVSFVAAGGGKQLGRGFIRDGGATPRVTLKPGGHAHALIAVTYAPNACVPAKAAGYRVIPPDQFSSVFVSKPQDACTETGQADGHVEPIAAGA